MWKVYLVDDEPLARQELRYLLSKTKQVEIVGEADNVEDAKNEILTLRPDIAFLDIQLSGENGLDIAEFVKGLDRSPVVVFTTAHDEFALKAFDANAFDYILKPIDETRLQKCLDKCKKVQKAEVGGVREKLAVFTDGRISLVDFNKIVYISMSDKKSTVKTLETEFKTNDSLVAIEEKLPLGAFMRVHRSFIINLQHIVAVEPWFNSTYNLIMADRSKIPVSRTYVKDIRSKFGI